MADGGANGITDFVLCLKPDLKPVGKAGIWHDNEIGFLLARSCWGQGLAQEALSTIIPYFFSQKAIEVIVADVDPRNKASLGLLRKQGFEVYGEEQNTLCIGGQWVDSTYLKLTKEKWRELHPED